MSIGAANAADVLVAAPAGFVWTGGYVGLQAGYAWGKSHYSNEEYDDFADHDPKGGFGGVYAGYNHQLANNVVLGVDADLNYSGIDGSADFYWNGNDPEPGASADVRWTGAARVRLGYAMDRVLPYVAGGVAFADYRMELADEFVHSKTLTGWTIGGGLEYAATDNILLRAEYRYTDYGNDTWSDWAGGERVDLKTNDIRLGVAYKF